MRELHLFSGVGGGILGGILLGHTCVCAVEIEPYCRKVLLQRQRDGILPQFPIWDDVRTFDGKPWRGLVDVVCAGIPCQKFSTSGLMSGNEPLIKEFIRIVSEIQPRSILLENVPSISFRTLGTIVGTLAEMGYDTRNGVIGCDDAGMEHRRKRLWMVAHSVSQRRKEMVRFGIYGNPENKIRSSAHVDTPANRISRIEKRLGKPGVLGVNDGLPNRVDRLAAIGNAQVPTVVKLAWETLS